MWIIITWIRNISRGGFQYNLLESMLNNTVRSHANGRRARLVGEFRRVRVTHLSRLVAPTTCDSAAYHVAPTTSVGRAHRISTVRRRGREGTPAPPDSPTWPPFVLPPSLLAENTACRLSLTPAVHPLISTNREVPPCRLIAGTNATSVSCASNASVCRSASRL